MKRVVIVRHAKAVPYGYDDDFTRDLTERGKDDAALVSGELRKRNIVPDNIISSPAKRALKTARIFADNLKIDRNRIRQIDEIYDGLTTSDFLDLIYSLSENTESVFFFGHNPGFHYLVNNLSEHNVNEMPTCSTVGIDFNVNSWNEVEARIGQIAFRITPKMLK
ncbi:phosphohistidine phosphatase, SixA [Mariniphaga anaerophila]|uniref:Phosphohistidine phosphatase, SixA n=1 Tax=Mariniphaga anaerophila TaxID=1484053 RepID=A0A1M4VZD1_9BACT|nr:histidine phosphatase family protein [Mariniphaga anaerophila]SHE74072.1 phosphohistidine phosphatase, SixA [Mariniphaga anaerophila]